jgi:hypothetical protein
MPLILKPINIIQFYKLTTAIVLVLLFTNNIKIVIITKKNNIIRIVFYLHVADMFWFTGIVIRVYLYHDSRY